MDRKRPEQPLAFIRACIRAGQVFWTYHVNMRLGQRFLTREAILGAAETYELVEAYPDDKYFPSYLLLGRSNEVSFHVLVGVDVEERNVRIVTAYRPNLTEWETDFEDQEELLMKCTVCGSRMNPVTTDLPFKLSAGRIAILKQLPVLQCETCQEYLLEDCVMARVDEMLARTDDGPSLR